MLLLAGATAAAQDEHHHGGAMAEHIGMKPGPLGLPRTREGSGTSWQPDRSPMQALPVATGAWILMLHWNVFAGFDYQGSDRGDSMFAGINWFMFMARRPAWSGEFETRVMLSLEAATVGAHGYPLLLQTGESFRGEPLHDRQHPHDLFMELSAQYTRPLGDWLGLQLYAAPSGEPALGPDAYPHRPSAWTDPLAPLGHHWQDSTHIAFGVLTAGLFTRVVKLEGSWFNGREPDEHRWDIDLRVPDSVSGRLSVNPAPWLSLQGSFGYLRSPEELEPGENLRRITASAMYADHVGEDGWVAATFVWGRNIHPGGEPTDTLLLEGTLDLGRNVLFTRAELATKDARELALPGGDEETVFKIGCVGLGYMRELGTWASLVPALGVRGALNFVGADLSLFYGTRMPAGVMVYLRVHPAEMQMGAH